MDIDSEFWNIYLFVFFGNIGKGNCSGVGRGWLVGNFIGDVCIRFVDMNDYRKLIF